MYPRHEAAIHKACGAGKIRAGKDYWKLILLKWNKSNCDVFVKECTLFDNLANGEIALETFITIIRKLSKSQTIVNYCCYQYICYVYCCY